MEWAPPPTCTCAGADRRPGSLRGQPHTPSRQLWCIVVALHVLAVPVQCFHSASQRPARPSRDSPPRPRRGPCWARASHPGKGEGGVHAAGSATPSAHRAERGFTPERKCIPEGQTLRPSLGFGPRWPDWHFRLEVACGPGQRASPAGQAVCRMGLWGSRVSLCIFPLLVSHRICLHEKTRQSQLDLVNERG